MSKLSNLKVCEGDCSFALADWQWYDFRCDFVLSHFSDEHFILAYYVYTHYPLTIRQQREDFVTTPKPSI